MARCGSSAAATVARDPGSPDVARLEGRILRELGND
jgi:hypothetical protein